MASLKFHKVTALPASCALGDVYYVVGKGIYVCTKEASSGANEANNYQRFSYSNAATSDAKGVVSLTDIKGVKVSNATKADSATTATDYASTGGIASKFTGITDDISTINTKIGKINAVVNGKTLTITKPDGSTVAFTETDTHNKHGHTFSPNTATTTADTATSVDVVSALNAATATDGNLSSTYDMVKVPTLKVTNKLASDIADLKSINTTGMQYKGTTAAVPSSGKVGDVYKVTTAIQSLGAEVGDFIVCRTATNGSTAATWDIWQANVTKDAYWDQNTPVSGKLVVADGDTGKIKTINYTADSFAPKSHNQASSTINAMTGYAKASSATAIATSDSLNVAIGKLEKGVEDAQSTADSKEPTSTAVRHASGKAVGSASQPVYVDSTGAATACSFTVQTSVPANAKFTDTHHEAAFTINDGQSTPVAAQTFSQKDAKTLAIKAAAASESHLTASTSAGTANSGVLTVNVGVASGYAIPSNSQITAWNNKYDANSFNTDNFDASGNIVSLVWATFA